MSKLKNYRTHIGMDIIVSMVANDELPIGNADRLASVMMEYFHTEGFADQVHEDGYRWTPDSGYWKRSLPTIRSAFRKEKNMFLEYIRDFTTTPISGSWKFLRKAEYEKVMAQEQKNLETRADNYNDRTEDGHKKWQLPNTPRLDVRPVEIGMGT